MDLTGGGQIFARLRRHCALNSSIFQNAECDVPVGAARCVGQV